MTVVSTPNVTQGLITMLAAADLGAATGRVWTDVPASPKWPLVAVQRIAGGPDGDLPVDLPTVQIDAWATTEGEAWSIADRVVRALRAATFVPFTDGWLMGDAAIASIVWLPDRDAGVARYSLTVQLITRAMEVP